MLYTLLLLPGLLGASLAGPVPSPRECAWGTAAWCRDLRSAAACGAVEHCRGAVWSQAPAKSLSCMLCRDVVAAANNGLNPDATQTDVLALLAKICEWLPSPVSAAGCRRMVAAQSSAVLGLLSGGPGSAPAQACMALTLCQPLQRRPASLGPVDWGEPSGEAAPSAGSEALRFHPSPSAEGAACRACVGLMSRLQAAAGSHLLGVAEVSVQEECVVLGPGLAPLCETYIHQLLAPAQPALATTTPRQICFRGGFCERPEGTVRRAQAPAVPSLELAAPRRRGEVQMQAGLTCEVCMQVVQELDQWLETNRTEALISHSLEQVCRFMPPTIMQQCVTLVDSYSPSLVQLITRVTPEKVCTAVHLCSSRRRARSLREARGAHSSHAATTTPSSLLHDLENQGSFCGACKRLLGVSTRNLDSKSTKRDILAAFKGGCSVLPLPYTAQCSRFVTDYEPVLIESLREVMDPEALCRKMGACHLPHTTLLGTDQCVLGPSLWCRSPELAEMCGATEHCRRHMWKDAAPDASGHA
ncbi:proactivator polypeptide-like 1 [Sorex araneus]|uniref:proactivator polypeptide-like 1 n=1 Tax=Sorex araneus TaxID=42254 RepID=UPI0024338F76|nr:proactivator polypeptide-like 1 [Sorex araneus]